MQRKATKRSTRAANADEKRFMKWVAQQPCIISGNYPVIVDHCYGSSFIHQKVLIGHWALLPLSPEVDAVKTRGNHQYYKDMFGETQSESWFKLIQNYPEPIPQEVIDSVMDWGK